MRSQITRLQRLAQRYRTDRRLPPPVVNLFRTTMKLRVRSRIDGPRAAVRSLAARSSSASGQPVAWGGRTYWTAGDLSMSTHELGHETASSVSRAVEHSDVGHVLVGRVGDGLAFGVALADRERALACLGDLEGDGWYVEWRDGSRSGIVDVGDVDGDRHLRRARLWTVFRAHRFGDQMVGLEQGTRISFWERGTSGQLEKVGVRGHARYDERSPATIEVVDGHPYPGNTAFPIGTGLDHFDLESTPIDIVYTWVDGSDPEWARAFLDTAKECGRDVDEAALDPARYRSRDELKYSLRSVWAHCGWVRRIWIVTAGQRPEWLVEDDRIRVVDHRDILPADALPTFNSHAIEAALHRIDGLAEHFVYFNDDMFVARPLRPEAFFTSNGLARVFQSGACPPGIEDNDTIAVDTGALRGRELLQQRFGRVAIDKPYHSPYPQRRSSSEEMEREFDLVGDTQRSRFRSSTDLSTAASFAQHYAVATQRAVFAQIETEYVHVESGRLNWHLERIRLGDDLDTFCVNETGIAEVADDRELQLAAFFDRVQPIAAPWERQPPQ